MRLSSNKCILVAILIGTMVYQLYSLVRIRHWWAEHYRYEERQAAFHEYALRHSPESKAAWDRENQMLDYHQRTMALSMMAAVVIEGGVVVVVVRRSRRNESDAKGS